MASTDNSDLLNEDKLKPELENLAAEILRRNKNIKKVEIKEKIEAKETRTGAGKPGGGAKAGEKAEGRKADQAQGGGEKQSEGSGKEKPNKEQSAEKQPGEKESGGKEPGVKDQADKQTKGDSDKNKGEPGDKPKEQEKGGEKGDDGGEEEGKKEGEKKEGEEGKEKDGEKQGDKEPGQEPRAKGEAESEGQEDSQAGGGEETARPAEDPSASSGQGGEGKKFEAGGGRLDPSADSAGSQQADNNIDNRLLNPEDENDAAKKLKEKKRGDESEGEAGESAAEAAEDKPKSLRQRVIAARQAMNLKEQAKKKLEEKVMAPAKQGTNWLLKAAWLNLIDSFGLTLIYINMHVFLRWIFPDLFCKLGEEWIPKTVARESSAKNVAGTAFGIIEIIGLLIIDLLILAVILGALGIIVMIADFMQASILSKIKMFIGGLTGLGWGGIKALYSLFKK